MRQLYSICPDPKDENSTEQHPPEQRIDSARRLLPEKEKEHMAIVDHLIEKYWETCFTNGYEKGFREGELEGRRKRELERREKGEVRFLAKVLRRRFGDLPEDALRHIDAADEEERLRINAAALAADSLAEVFEPRSNGKL